eukprot:m51a1_g13935 hypothetical protein (468) ;mRNA; r:870118-871622
MFEMQAYLCTWRLLSLVPLSSGSSKTMMDDVLDFNDEVKSDSRCRLVRDCRKVEDVSRLGFNAEDRIAMIRLMSESEEEAMRRGAVRDVFGEHFFTTNFWYMWCTTFAFQPWHSAAEFRRYLLRFIQEFPQIHTLQGVRRTRLNQFESFAAPIASYLRSKGVNFHTGTIVYDAEMGTADNGQRSYVSKLVLGGGKQPIALDTSKDSVLFTIGSMTANSSIGSHDEAPEMRTSEAPEWSLWQRIASKGVPGCGNPAPFDHKFEQTKWPSFTVTFRDDKFVEMMQKFSGNQPGTGGLVTFVNSNWLMSAVVPNWPHFSNQPEHVWVLWGYGLYPDKLGNFVRKPMTACSGSELLHELLGHMGMPEQDMREPYVSNATCIPCMMPYITSQFMPRRAGDRPEVIPKGAMNYGFIGQFVELADDVVFTVEYSVRSAMYAVQALTHKSQHIPPLYEGNKHIDVVLKALHKLLD